MPDFLGVLEFCTIVDILAITPCSLLYLPIWPYTAPVIRKFDLTQYMRLVSNPELSYIPWTAVLCGPFEGKAFLCGFAEAAPRLRLHLFALGVTLLPSAT